MNQYIGSQLLAAFALCFLFSGCQVQRDDTTSQVRMMMADFCEIDYDDAKPHRSLKRLGFESDDCESLIDKINENFDLEVTQAELEKAAAPGDIVDMTLLALANCIRDRRAAALH